MKRAEPARQAMVVNKADQSLWKGWRDARDGHAFRALVQPHLRFAHDIARRWGCCDADADDVVQDALLRLAQDPSERPVEVGLRAWLGREISLRARMRRRSEGRRHAREHKVGRRRKEASEPGPAGAAETVERELGALPESWREAIVLRYLHDLDYADLAGILGVSETACRVRVHRGIARLREKLGPGAGAMVAALPLQGPALPVLAPGLLSAGSTGFLGALALPKVLVGLGALVVLGVVLAALGTPQALLGEADTPPDDGRGAIERARTTRRGVDAPGLRGARLDEAPPVNAPLDDAAGSGGESAASAPSPPVIVTLVASIYARGGQVAVDAKASETAETPPPLVWLEEAKELRARPIVGIRAGEADPLPWLDALNETPGLRHLELTKTSLADFELGRLPVLPELRVLLLAETGAADGGVATLRDFPKLEVLDLSGCPLQGLRLDGLAPLPLRELHLGDTRYLEAASIPKIATLRGLRHLGLAGCRLADRQLAPLRTLSRLESLDLSRCRSLRLDPEGWWTKPWALERLVLRGARIPTRKIGLPRALEVLDLSETRIRIDAIQSLLACSRLRELHLAKTRARDRDLEPLSGTRQPLGLPALEVLDLTGTRVTKGFCEGLAGRTALRRLVVKDTYVRASEVEALKKLLPDLVVKR